jgi:flavorubredoxin
MKKVTNDIYYVGVNDHKTDLFESQFPLENGMAYNSYLILDEKIVIMDSVDEGFEDGWFHKIDEVIKNRKPDYLVVSHMEPDHSSSIGKFLAKYPDTTLVLTAKASQMVKQFFRELKFKELIVKENDTLNLGTHILKFIMAPMIHWPEVMFTYDQFDKVLFSADAFGKFGALDYEDPEGWACEARRYYFGIVGKYGAQVQAAMAKLSNLTINTICALHGPILDSNLDYYLNIYNTWSKYEPEDKGIFIASASIYGNTYKACEKLKELLEKEGIKVSLADLSREDIFECYEDAFRYDRLVLACSTYNATLFPIMNTFIEGLLERNYQNRKIAFIENGSWAPMAAKVMKEKFEKSKNIEFVDPVVKITSTLDDNSLKQLEELAKNLK